MRKVFVVLLIDTLRENILDVIGVFKDLERAKKVREGYESTNSRQYVEIFEAPFFASTLKKKKVDEENA